MQAHSLGAGERVGPAIISRSEFWTASKIFSLIDGDPFTPSVRGTAGLLGLRSQVHELSIERTRILERMSRRFVLALKRSINLFIYK